MKNKTLMRYYYFGAIAAAVLTAITHTVLYLNQYDFAKGLWQSGTPAFLSAVLYFLLIPTAALALLFVRALERAKSEENVVPSDKKTKFSRITTILTAALLILTVAAQFAAIGSSDKLAALLDPLSQSYMALTATLHILTLLFALPAAWYFLSAVFFKGDRIVFGIFTILYFVFYTLRVYFDMTMHINNPRWSFAVVVLIFVMLYFVFEVHRLIRREMTRLYLLSGFLAMTLAFTKAAADLVMAIGSHTRDGFELVYSGLLLAVAVYIASRLWEMTDLENETVTDGADGTVSDTTDTTDTTDTIDETDVTDEALDEASNGAEDAFEELTADELKRFYGAVYQTVAKKRGLSETASDDEKAEVRREAMAVIEHLLNGDSRQENVMHMREFLARVEGQEG